VVGVVALILDMLILKPKKLPRQRDKRFPSHRPRYLLLRGKPYTFIYSLYRFSNRFSFLLPPTAPTITSFISTMKYARLAFLNPQISHQGREQVVFTIPVFFFVVMCTPTGNNIMNPLASVFRLMAVYDIIRFPFHRAINVSRIMSAVLDLHSVTIHWMKPMFN